MFKIAPSIARHWPFANGSGRIIDKFAKSVDLGLGERIAQTSDGFPMRVYAEDLIGRHLIMSGKFDRSVIQLLLDRAQPGDVFLDIGSNIGYYSAVFLAKVKDATAICFEPQPGVADLLMSNVRQFTQRATVYQVGLADKGGELRFHIDHANRGASRISPEGETMVPVCDAKDVFARFARVDLMKIDVEGYELPIFSVIEDELDRLKPRSILFEDQTGGAAPHGALGSILTRVGYSIFGIDKKLFKTNLVPIITETDCRYNDYLAIL